MGDGQDLKSDEPSSLEGHLFAVFNELRLQGVPIGLGDYLLADRTLRDKNTLGGNALDDLEHLKRVCRLLWAKSKEDVERLDNAFARLFEPAFEIYLGQKAEGMEGHLDDLAQLPPSKREHQGKNQSGQIDAEAVAQSTLTSEFNLLGVAGESAKLKKTYQLTPQLPLAARDMTAIWRHLRRLQRQGPLLEFDVAGTIGIISRTGFLLYPAMLPPRRNQARLVILLDVHGSMAPFSLVIDTAIESILRGGLLGHIALYYFHDSREQFFYKQPSLSGAVPVDIILDEDIKNNSVLIVSDAGAARGDYDGARAEVTRSFLKKLNDYTYLSAWLNPVPSTAWDRSTAIDISKMIPMFPLDRGGLLDVVNVLRGQPYSKESKPHER